MRYAGTLLLEGTAAVGTGSDSAGLLAPARICKREKGMADRKGAEINGNSKIEGSHLSERVRNGLVGLAQDRIHNHQEELRRALEGIVYRLRLLLQFIRTGKCGCRTAAAYQFREGLLEVRVQVCFVCEFVRRCPATYDLIADDHPLICAEIQPCEHVVVHSSATRHAVN